METEIKINLLQLSPVPYNKDSGGLYIIQNSFRDSFGAKTLDTVSLDFSEDSEADYHLKQFNILNPKANYGIPVNLYSLLSRLSRAEIQIVVIHCLFQFHALVGYFLAKIKKIPYIIVLNGTLDPYVFSYRALPKYLWMYGMGTWILKNADAIICTTRKEAEKAHRYLQGTNVEICPLGVQVPTFNPQEVSQYREEIREKLGIEKPQKILLFLGRIHPMKRPIETAFAFRKQLTSDWVYLMVGNISDTEKDRLKSVVDNQRIYYHPPAYGLNKWKFMLAADAFVHLSFRENFGYSVAEAAAVGLPLLLSDGIDIYPLLEESGGADVIPIHSEEDIDRGLAGFLDKTATQHEEMGKKAQKVFQENFSPSIFQKRWGDLWQKYSQKKLN